MKLTEKNLKKKLRKSYALDRIRSAEMQHQIELERARKPRYVLQLKDGTVLLPRTKARLRKLWLENKNEVQKVVINNQTASIIELLKTNQIQ